MQRPAWRIGRDVSREILANVAMALPMVRTRRLKRPRAGARFTGATDLLDRYAFQALRGVEDVLGSVRGRDILEFGPGDTLSAGLSMLAAQARSYTALDRFVADYSSAEAKNWYHGIRHAWGTAFPGKPWPEDLDPARFPEEFPDLVMTLNDSVESLRSSRRFDVVTSWQVGDHVLDIQSSPTRRHVSYVLTALRFTALSSAPTLGSTTRIPCSFCVFQRSYGVRWGRTVACRTASVITSSCRRGRPPASLLSAAPCATSSHLRSNSTGSIAGFG